MINKFGKSSKSTFFYVGAFIILAIFVVFYSYKVVEAFVPEISYSYYYKHSNGKTYVRSNQGICPTSNAYKNLALTDTGCNSATTK